MDAQRQRPVVNGSSRESVVKVDARNGEGSVNSRAQLFEDEKRRIIDSCFTKREPDGAFAESYITHIRITEDASCPSSPPPPSSAPDNKKSRAIIVAVKRSGRVRLHKARENNNGTFSIGKTWVLDDLTAIESFTGSMPTTYQDQQRKEWAGVTGVLVTVQKPYFWQINSQKEKDFFIGSLIKIYRKYTQGREPQLSGFTSREMSDFSVTGAQRPPTSQPPSTSPAPLDQPPPPYTGAPPSRTPLPDRGANGINGRELRPPSSDSASTSQTDRPVFRSPALNDSSTSLRSQDPAPRFQKLRSGSNSSSIHDSLRPATSRDGLSSRNLGPKPSNESLPQQEMPPPTSAPERVRANGTYSPFPRKDDSAFGRPPGSPGRPPRLESPLVPGPRSTNRRPSASSRKASDPPSPIQDNLPERRRPPLPAAKSSQDESNRSTPANFSTPKEAISPEPSAEVRKPPDQPIVDSDPVLEEPKRSAADFFLTASKKMKEIDSTRPITAEAPAESPTDIKDISQALVSSPTESPTTPEEVIHRPGLGPMIRKKKSSKEVATAFRKMAAAANAFKPRVGGAGDRLRDELARTPNTPDGIHGVFVAPSREALRSPQPPPSASAVPEEPMVQEPSVSTQEALQAPISTQVEPKRSSDTLEVPPLSIPNKIEEKKETKPPQEERKKQPSDHSMKYAKALGIEPGMLEGRTIEIDSVLTDFGWSETMKTKKTFEDLQADIRRDLAKIETGSWIGSFEYGDERVAVVDKLLDKAIAECDELDGLLTLYNVELGTLSEDVAYIEAQSQGLQVQTANQRLLHNELQSLLSTIAIPSSQLNALRQSRITQTDGILEIGNALVQLYKAMLTIDPSMKNIGQDAAKESSSDLISNEVSAMRAVQERKGAYQKESFTFAQRFNGEMTAKFEKAESDTTDSLDSRRSLALADTKIDLTRRDEYRSDLQQYSAFVLFEREIVKSEWEKLLLTYEDSIKQPYTNEFRDNVSLWKRVAKKSSSEEQETLFTTQEKETESLGRKLTVKRSKTLREGPRNVSGDKGQEGKIPGYEAFAGALTDMSQAIFLEQNFMVDLFHLHTQSSADFPELVSNMSLSVQRPLNLGEPRPYESDRNIARRVRTSMESVYSFWPSELQNFVDWVVVQEPLQGVGVMFAIECRTADLEASNQEYICQTLSGIRDRLTTRFETFVREQISAIEDQKVRHKKRKGVLAFMKTFPYFTSAIETMLPSANGYPIRTMVDKVYGDVNQAMFETLRFIAKDSPVAIGGQKSQGQGTGEAEDKEILNYHILLIENMNHYLEEVDAKGNHVLQEGKENALKEMTEHLDLYLSAIIRRPLGKLLDFLESTESLMASATDGSASIANRASHSRSTFKKVLSTYDSKEVNKGIDALKKRVVKHFGEADDPNLSQSLIAKVFRECGERYVSVYDRTAKIVAEVYEGSLDIEFKREDIPVAFRRG